MNLKFSVILGIVLLLAGATIGYLLSPKKDRQAEDILESERLQLQSKVSYLKRESDFFRAHTYKLIQDYAVTRDSLKQAQEMTSTWKKKYEQSKKTHLPANTTDAELDSIFSVIISR